MDCEITKEKDFFAEIELLLKWFAQLRELLIKENGKSWISPVDNIINALIPPYTESYSAKNALINSANLYYLSISNGHGSLGEFYIWRDDYAERVKLNNELKSLKMEIVKILKKYNNRLSILF